MEFAAWIRGYLGDARYDMLTERHNRITKRTKADLEALYAHLKHELAAIEADPFHMVAAYD